MRNPSTTVSSRRLEPDYFSEFFALCTPLDYSHLHAAPVLVITQ